MHNEKFTVSSPAFKHSRAIPSKYANTGVLGGKNISLPLEWEHAPEGTKSFAISIIDLHPVANNWVHWFVINIPDTVTSIQEGATTTNKLPHGAKELNNSFEKLGYGGPQPPKGTGVHKYEITMYALNVKKIDLEIHTSLAKFLSALEGKIISTARIIGVYERL
ncbi:MAG: YbhB/YbcL family Raf kinase inhibitor-like protein [Bacteroidetes bacterium]|nr:MAG: YbhB/YbcL family Raf kinase inhibitor-like protein [Bacteroidota bacterium]